MKKKWILLSYILVIICAFTGCKVNKSIQYDDATSGQATEEQTDVDDIEPPTHLDMTIHGARSSAYVDADIILPDGYRNCNVVEYTDVIFTDEDIKSYADKIFDKDSYFVYMPYSEEECGRLKNELANLKSEASDNWESIAYDRLVERMDNIQPYYESDFDDFEELRFYPIYDKIYDREINKCDLIGTIDGERFLLSFNKDKTNCYMKLTRLKQLGNFDKQDVGAESLDVQVEGNVCTYSQPEAEELARDYVELLGFDSMDIIQTNNVRYDYWEGEFILGDKDPTVRKVDGYNIYFGRHYENYSMVYSNVSCRNTFENAIEFIKDREPVFAEGNEYIRIYVDSDGISEVEIFNPMEFSQVLSEEPVVLSYSKVEDIFEESFNEHTDGIGGFDLNIYEIRLGYDVVIDGEKKALVPTWFVFYDDSSHESNYCKTAFLRVNALDGTIKSYWW